MYIPVCVRACACACVCVCVTLRLDLGMVWHDVLLCCDTCTHARTHARTHTHKCKYICTYVRHSTLEEASCDDRRIAAHHYTGHSPTVTVAIGTLVVILTQAKWQHLQPGPNPREVCVDTD